MIADVTWQEVSLEAVKGLVYLGGLVAAGFAAWLQLRQLKSRVEESVDKVADVSAKVDHVTDQARTATLTAASAAQVSRKSADQLSTALTQVKEMVSDNTQLTAKASEKATTSLDSIHSLVNGERTKLLQRIAELEQRVKELEGRP